MQSYARTSFASWPIVRSELLMTEGKSCLDISNARRIRAASCSDTAGHRRLSRPDVEINAKGRLSRGSDKSAEVLRVDIAFTPLLDAQ